jgi:hypothetical protein
MKRGVPDTMSRFRSSRSDARADSQAVSQTRGADNAGDTVASLRSQLEIPAVYEHWRRIPPTDNRTVVEYWKRGSTHVAGSHEQLRVSVSRDGETLRLANQVYDPFGHTVPRSTSTLSEQAVDRLSWIEQRLRKYMGRYPGEEGFDSPPEFPTRIGRWTAVSRQHYGGAEATRWVFDPGQERDPGEWGPVSLSDDDAVLLLEETDIQSGYCAATRYFEIRYRDAEIRETTIASDVPRRSAFEIAHHTLSSLPQPVEGLPTARRELEAVTGIGSAKSRDLLLLGICDRADLRSYLADGSSVGHHHADRVDALLTSKIRSSL